MTKWAATIPSADRAPAMLRRAFALLRSGRPGPVLLEMPGDVAAEAMTARAITYSPPRRLRTGADPDAIEAAARTLLKAELPLLFAGQGVLYAEAGEELAALAEALAAPVITTLAGKSAIAESHPLAAGYAGYTGTAPAYHYLRESDVLFGVGTSFSKGVLLAAIPPGKVLIQATIDERDLNKDYAVDHAIQGDAKLVLAQMIDVVRRLGGSRRPLDERKAQVARLRQAWLAEWMPKLTSIEVPINPYRVVWDLMHTVDRRRTIVTHDSGNPRDQLAPFYEVLVPRGYIGWGKSTQLGYSLGLTMGAKLAAPERLCVNVMGDAAFGMAGLDLETAVRAGIGILTVVLNNSALGNYEEHMPIATERYRLKYLTGDYARVAQGLGAHAEQVREPDQIVPGLKRGIEVADGGRPAVVEVITREEPAFSAS